MTLTSKLNLGSLSNQCGNDFHSHLIAACFALECRRSQASPPNELSCLAELVRDGIPSQLELGGMHAQRCGQLQGINTHQFVQLIQQSYFVHHIVLR